MTISGGEFCFCFECWTRYRFSWTADGTLICPACQTPEGIESLMTPEVYANIRNQQIRRDSMRAKKFTMPVAAAMLLFLFTSPLAAELVVIGNDDCVALDTGAVSGVPLTDDCSLSVRPNENLKRSYVDTSTTQGLDSFKAAFDFNMKLAVLTPNKQTHIWQIQRSDRNAWLARVTVQYRTKLGIYRARAIARMTSGNAKTPWITLPDPADTYRLTVSWSADGPLSLQVNDWNPAVKAPTLEWMTQTTGNMRLGAPANTKHFTGAFLFDEVSVTTQ